MPYFEAGAPFAPYGQGYFKGNIATETLFVTPASWAGDGRRDGRPAHLALENSPRARRQWSIPWHARPGPHTIRVRARDDRGNTQPTSVPFNEQGYLFGAVVAHPVSVG